MSFKTVHSLKTYNTFYSPIYFSRLSYTLVCTSSISIMMGTLVSSSFSSLSLSALALRATSLCLSALHTTKLYITRAWTLTKVINLSTKTSLQGFLG